MKKILFSLSVFLISICVIAQNSIDLTSFNDFKYRNVGPSRGGRVTAVAGVESDPSTYYMGATGGGVWKTSDYGRSWRNISDGYFLSPSIGSIRVFQANPDIVYVGTGSDGIRSNVIIGKGVYRSDDAGESWKFIGLDKAGQVGAVLIDPSNPDRVFVAAIGNPFGANEERGVFRTEDGGATWEKVLYISENTGACDLEFHPENPDILYAGVWTARRKPWTIISGSEEGGIYKSSDGGSTWDKSAGGLPVGIIGKSDLAVCKAEPDLLYVLMEAENDQGGLYISEDKGETFELISKHSFLLDRPFYYTNIDVDPTNPDIIYSNSTGFYRSKDRGINWERRSTPHGDNHDMWINPSYPDIYIQSNDGGANITLNGGVTWSSQNNQPTAELYQVNVDDQVPYWLYAGQQDNTTVAIPSVSSSSYYGRGQESIMSVGGCETGPAVPKPGDHNIVYSNCKGRFGRYNKITKQEKKYYVGAANMYGHNPADLKFRFQRVSPILVSPHNSRIVYHASQYLHRTMDEGVTWETISPDLTAFEPDKQVISGSPITRDITGEEFYSTIYAVAESPRQAGVIWTGANDGPVYLTRDNGKTWKNVTPDDLPPGGRVQNFEASPHNPAKAYFACYRYLLDDWTTYIYKTEDYGETWTRITKGIPGNEPARVVREDPFMEGLLFAGTEAGLYVSTDDGLSWNSFQYNLPLVSITDIRIFRDDLAISTMGRSFWIMDDISPLRELSRIGNGDVTYLFSPGNTFRSPSVQGNYINYYLGEDSENVRLIIENTDGKAIMEFSSEKDRQAARTKGFHRLMWNLRTYGPSSGGRRPSRGPKVIPGRYNITLLVDDTEYKSTMEVLPDPVIVADGMSYGDYKEQFDLSVKIVGLITEAAGITSEIEKLYNDLNDKKKAKGRLSRKDTRLFISLNELRNKLVTASIRYPQPMLNDQLRYLYSMVSATDQKIGNDAFIRYDELKERLFSITNSFEGLVD